MLSLNIPPWKQLGWLRRPQPWTTGDWQLHHNNVTAHTSYLVQRFLAKHQVTQVTQPHYSPDVEPCEFWLFPKLKSPLKEKRFQTVDEIQENTTGKLMVTGWTVWGPKVPALKGTEVPLSCVHCFSYLISSSINVSVFHITWLDIPFGKTLDIHMGIYVYSSFIPPYILWGVSSYPHGKQLYQLRYSFYVQFCFFFSVW